MCVKASFEKDWQTNGLQNEEAVSPFVVCKKPFLKAFFKGQRTALTYHFNVIAENRLHLKDILKLFNSYVKMKITLNQL